MILDSFTINSLHCELSPRGTIKQQCENHAQHRSAVTYHLVGLVVKASASRAEDPEFESRLRRDFSSSNHTSNLKIGTLGACHYRVSAGTGRPGVSIL